MKVKKKKENITIDVKERREEGKRMKENTREGTQRD